MKTVRPSIEILSALHVLDCLSEHILGIKQARILMVMHLTGANSARKIQLKTMMESHQIRGVLCHLRIKEMLVQVTGGAMPTYQLTEKAHNFLSAVSR